ncbi:MAG TPA: HAMP domain-containing sensor histidine kinase, partial [Tenuifilaceae bacterium]|nr:HAMP domain-containing sensor histidine kinase [Tenuifilaceae bacterium]
ESIHITVTDNGTGIAPEVMEHIFTPFFTTKANGSGIGLSIAKSIMQLHGGSISCRSEDGCTEFKLVFGV